METRMPALSLTMAKAGGEDMLTPMVQKTAEEVAEAVSRALEIGRHSPHPRIVRAGFASSGVLFRTRYLRRPGEAR